MLRILKFLITGRWYVCNHTDEIIENTDVVVSDLKYTDYYCMKEDKQVRVIGRLIVNRCTKCGRIESKKITLTK